MRFLLVLALLSSSAPALAQVSACPATPSTTPLLTDYSHLQPGTRHRITVRWSAASRSWQPHPALDMPLHHASSLEYAEGPALPARSGPDLEITVTAIDRRLVDYRARENTWLFAYRVRVDSICARGR